MTVDIDTFYCAYGLLLCWMCLLWLYILSWKYFDENNWWEYCFPLFAIQTDFHNLFCLNYLLTQRNFLYIHNQLWLQNLIVCYFNYILFNICWNMKDVINHASIDLLALYLYKIKNISMLYIRIDCRCFLKLCLHIGYFQRRCRCLKSW